MSIFVLVHGAGQTSASWDLVIPRLREAGRTVVVARLSGLENDNVPLSPAINLRTHIEDVSRLLVEGNLEQVTLVGHSYGGMIITGVAEALVDRLDRLVYVDALIPADGQCALDLLPEPLVQMFRQAAESSGNGWRLRAGESYLDLWGLKPGPERDFVRERMSDFSLRCFEEVITLPSNAASKLDRTFIACVAEDTLRDLFSASLAIEPRVKDGSTTSSRPVTTVMFNCRIPLCLRCWRLLRFRNDARYRSLT